VLRHQNAGSRFGDLNKEGLRFGVEGLGCWGRQLLCLRREVTGRGSGYQGYSKARTRIALGPYGRSIPRSIGGDREGVRV